MATVDIQRLCERQAARRTFPVLARTKVCRSLFGPVDHDELDRDMKRRLQQISERDQSRWNFNFEDNVPLPGHYEWEEISVNTVPAFYMPVHPGKGRAREEVKHRGTESSSSECVCLSEADTPQSTQSPSASVTVNQENREHITATVYRRAKRAGAHTFTNNNTHITDFFPKRKRSLDMKSTSQSCSSIPAEVTPRKRIR